MFDEKVESDGKGHITGLVEPDGTHVDLGGFWDEGIVVKENGKNAEVTVVDI